MQNIFEKHTLLAPLTTMRVGGPARFLLSVRNIHDLKKGILFAKEKKVPFFVLGGGSNIIVGDRGFSGLVLKMDMRSISFEDIQNGKTFVTVSAGENWDAFVGETVARGLYGVENLSHIPGTVGAAPVQNIGAYGMEVKNSILWVEVFDTNTMRTKKLARDECAFSYRDSIFKQDEGKNLIVTNVCFLLERDGSLNTGYKDVQDYLHTHSMRDPSLSEIRDIVVAIRKSKLPDWNMYGTVGSFFKNPVISLEKANELKKRFSEMPLFPAKDGVKIPIAWILDHVLLWKGKSDGPVGVFSCHSLAIINHGGATAVDITMFAKKIQQDVLKKTGISIEPEVSFVGEF
ncbi:MAG TPA: UDP-N-acetylmuramate dehydrogenase [Candidatus Paceibacterota bacterium]